MVLYKCLTFGNKVKAKADIIYPHYSKWTFPEYMRGK